MLKFCIGNDLFQLSDMLEYFEHIRNWGSGLKIPDAPCMMISYSSFVCVCVCRWCSCMLSFRHPHVKYIYIYICYHVRGMNRPQEMTIGPQKYYIRWPLKFWLYGDSASQWKNLYTFSSSLKFSEKWLENSFIVPSEHVSTSGTNYS